MGRRLLLALTLGAPPLPEHPSLPRAAGAAAVAAGTNGILPLPAFGRRRGSHHSRHHSSQSQDRAIRSTVGDDCALAFTSARPARFDRRRRGGMRNYRRGHGPNFLGATLALELESGSDGESPAAAMPTRYTIDGSVCPPTDPERLRAVVGGHIAALPKYWRSKPVAAHTAEAFEKALAFVVERGRQSSGKEDGSPTSSLRVKVILDCGCGTGRSSLLLGEMHKDCVVIGIDRSLVRLSRNRRYDEYKRGGDRDFRWRGTRANESDEQGARVMGADNVLLVRAELSDFWRCCLSSSEWCRRAIVVSQYLLYPNPYPKPSRLKSRIYAHPAFPLMMMMTMASNRGGYSDETDGGMGSSKGLLVVRSNWRGYLEEFASAVDVWFRMGGSFAHFETSVRREGEDEWCPGGTLISQDITGPVRLDPKRRISLTNFEEKFLKCGEPVYELSLGRHGKI